MDGFPDLDAYDGPDSYIAALAGLAPRPYGGEEMMLVLADFIAEDEKEVSVKRGTVVSTTAAAPHHRMARARLAARVASSAAVDVLSPWVRSHRATLCSCCASPVSLLLLPALQRG